MNIKNLSKKTSTYFICAFILGCKSKADINDTWWISECNHIYPESIINLNNYNYYVYTKYYCQYSKLDSTLIDKYVLSSYGKYKELSINHYTFIDSFYAPWFMIKYKMNYTPSDPFLTFYYEDKRIGLRGKRIQLYKNKDTIEYDFNPITRIQMDNYDSFNLKIQYYNKYLYSNKLTVHENFNSYHIQFQFKYRDIIDIGSINDFNNDTLILHKKNLSISNNNCRYRKQSKRYVLDSFKLSH